MILFSFLVVFVVKPLFVYYLWPDLPPPDEPDERDPPDEPPDDLDPPLELPELPLDLEGAE